MSKIANIHDLINSGKLEQYVVGAIQDVVEVEKIEEMIKSYPQVASVYQQLQEDLNDFTLLDAVDPPERLKLQILSGLASNERVKKNNGTKDQYNVFKMVAIAASLLLIVSLGGLLFSNKENGQLREDLMTLRKDNALIQEQIATYKEEKEIIGRELKLIADIGTQKYILNDRKSNLKVVAYHNSDAKFAKIQVEQLPVYDQNSDYQLWADVDGEMISLAVLRSEASSFNVDSELLDKASSLNVTLEKAGGSEHATVENLVTNINLATKP